MRAHVDVRSADPAVEARVLGLWQEVSPAYQAAENFEALFGAIASSPSFAKFWSGPSRAPFLLPRSALVAQSLSFDDVVHGLAVAASCGRRRPCESALTLTDGAAFRCPVALPPIATARELEEVLKYGTVFLNTASLHWRSPATICLAANEVLQFPTNINVYVTGENRRISTDVHTDNHDVFVLQTEGAKHWQVYAPPKRAPGAAHPLYRGKHEDHLAPSELGPPLLSVVLRPGEVLFVPLGFPHATSTEGAASAGPSVHLTLGISAADYSFCLGGLRQDLLSRLGRDAALDEERLPDDIFWRLLAPTPVGCLVPAQVWEAHCPEAAHDEHVAAELQGLMGAAGLAETQGEEEEEKFQYLAQEAVREHLARQRAVVASQSQAYQEVAAAPDGIFLCVGPEETCSSYRRAMLEHQVQEDARKRARAEPRDVRFVRRVDPTDGASRTWSDICDSFAKRGLDMAAARLYWDTQCLQLYPNDEPPEDLMSELEQASEDCAALLFFLRKRTPHLHTSCAEALQRSAGELLWERVD